MALFNAFRNASTAQTRERFAEEVVRTIGPILRIYIRSRCPKDLVDDVLQETLVAILKGQSSFAGKKDEQLRAWCIRIARHKLADALSSEKKTSALSLDDAEISRSLEYAASDGREVAALRREWADVNAILSKLDPRCRELVKERYILGYDFETIGSSRAMSADGARMATKRCVESAQRFFVKG